MHLPGGLAASSELVFLGLHPAQVRERAMGRLTRLQAAGTAGAEPHVQEVRGTSKGWETARLS